MYNEAHNGSNREERNKNSTVAVGHQNDIQINTHGQ